MTVAGAWRLFDNPPMPVNGEMTVPAGPGLGPTIFESWLPMDSEPFRKRNCNVRRLLHDINSGKAFGTHRVVEVVIVVPQERNARILRTLYWTMSYRTGKDCCTAVRRYRRYPARPTHGLAKFPSHFRPRAIGL